MNTRDGAHENAAVAAVARRAYADAGDTYTRAAWSRLADPREGLSPFEADEKGWVGHGCRLLVLGAICYRVAGLDARATRRGVEGVAVAGDLRETAGAAVQKACFAEVVADFRVAGGLDGATAAYETAADAYSTAGEGIETPQSWATTPLFEAATAPIKQVARGLADGEIAIKWEDLHGSDPSDAGAFLAHRATYKRQRFAGLVQRAIDEGVLAAPRGTTEYATDHHRCRHCGSRDVNWVADSTLCLRCSRPTDPQ